MKIVVKKYGGATLADPVKIKQVAKTLSLCHQSGERIVVAVSAMGQSTNELIHLAQQVSSRPKRRELDMLLSTGERVSMSLLSMALNDLSCPAISFTGSQAGVFTDDSHSNALITDIKCPRVKEALLQNQVVILAGFQGVSPKTKEVTTLGRGGTDTTAVAIAAALNADHCEILKDVPGVFSADPKLVPEALPIKELLYEQLLEMTFWGAKVLHYRSVELAFQRSVPLYIGPAHENREGTWVRTTTNTGPSHSKKDTTMTFETTKILSLNSHSEVLKLIITNKTTSESLDQLQNELNNLEIPFPQLLTTETLTDSELTQYLYLTGPQEILNSIKKEVKSFSIAKESLCTITATVTGALTPAIASQISQNLSEIDLQPLRLWMSSMSCTILLFKNQRDQALSHLQKLIGL